MTSPEALAGVVAGGGWYRMKLSEAIRLGALLKPQGRGPNSQKAGARKSCALGAAMDAYSLPPELRYMNRLPSLWPILDIRVEMPASHRHWLVRAESGRVSLVDAIWILNDRARWTREQIADWVEEIEQQQAPEALQALSLVGVGIE